MNEIPTATQSDGLERLLTISDLSEYLGIPVATLYDWRTDGVGPKAVKLGRALRYPVSRVRAWVEEQVDAARQSRVVLSQVLALAVRHNAMSFNPVPATASVRRSHKDVRSLSLQELSIVRRLIAGWRTGPGVNGPRPDGQLAQIFDVILGTSARIG